MTASSFGRSTSPTLLHGRWVWIGRLAWGLIFLYVVWKMILGTPLYLGELQKVCSEPADVCSERVSPTAQDVQEIDAAGLTLHQYANISLVFQLISSVVWIGIGLLIFALRSDDWMALLVSAMMIMMTSGSETDPIQQVYPHLAWFAEAGFSLQNILLFLVISLFPSGRFAPRWMRWYWLAMVSLGFVERLLLVLGVRADMIWAVGWLSFLTLGPYSQIYRYLKVSNQTERLQTKWVVFGFAGFAVTILSGVLLAQLNIIPNFTISYAFDIFSMLIPLGFGVAVLRYRLWDIDVIIRKTLVYTILTVALALVFFGGVALLQQIFGGLTGTENSPIAIVVSTLAIAALVNPLRRRIQDFIDRRFYRKKYNAEKTLARFASVARDETDIEQLSAELLAVVQETMQPESVSLWLKPQRRKR